MKPDQYCKKKVKNSKSSFYYSFLFLNKEKQRDIFAVYAFCREIDDIADNIQDKIVAKKKLDWWASDLNKCFINNQEPEHPVNKELKVVINKYNLKADIFNDLVDGMKMDINNTKYKYFNDLLEYCYKVAGTVGIACVNIFKYKDKSVFEYSENLANFLQLVNITRDCKEDCIKFDRVYIPQEILNKHDLSEESLKNIFVNNNDKEKFKKLILDFVKIAESYYIKYKNHLTSIDLKNQFPGYIMGEIYKEILIKIKKDPMIILKKKKISINPLKKIYIALKTYKNIIKIHKYNKLCRS